MIPFLPKQAFEGEPKTEYEYCPNIDTYNAGRGIFNVGYLEYWEWGGIKARGDALLPRAAFMYSRALIGHLRAPKTLIFKTRLSAKPLLWKWVLFAWESIKKSFPYQWLSKSVALKQRPKQLRNALWPSFLFPSSVWNQEEWAFLQRQVTSPLVGTIYGLFNILWTGLLSLLSLYGFFPQTRTHKPFKVVLFVYILLAISKERPEFFWGFTARGNGRI